jgi:phosphatidate cytidylyltransferase
MKSPAVPARAPSAAARARPDRGLLSRLAVAVIGLPVVLGVLWLGGWWLVLLALGAALLALHELLVLTRALRPIGVAAYVGLVCILLGIQLGGLAWGVGGLFVCLALAFVLKGLGETRGSPTVAVATTVLGTAWIGFGLGYMLLLRDIPEYGRLASFTVLIAIFASDTAAYVAGRLVGRHKLAPRISPGKTWEGFLAGSVAAIFTAFVALYQDRGEFLTIGEALVLGAVLAVSGPAGDLFESSVKRDMGVKDSGRLLGGHGGMLDRLDAVLFASIAAFYTILAFGAA